MCKAHSIDLGTIRRRLSTNRHLTRMALDGQECPLKRVHSEEGYALITLFMDAFVRYLFKLDDMLTVVEKYRAMLVSRVRTLLEWLLRACLHPASVCSLRDIQEWLFVWKCYFTNVVSFNTAEKDEKLLEWVRSRVGPKLEATDFGGSWRSGILLCALVESIAPGSCPRYDLLNPDNRLGNAQLAVQLIEKINLRPCLTAQELSNDDADIEKPLKALLAQFRMAAAKRKLRSAVKSPGDDRFLNGQTGELFAKGMGLIFAVKGRKASFNIFRRGQGAFSFVIEIQGPDGTLGSALITHKSVPRQPGSPTTPAPANPGPRGLKRQLSAESKTIFIDYAITNEKISVTYTPVTSGKHTLNIVAQGQHILRSPYNISVDCNTAEVTAKVVETLFRPKISALQRLGRRFSGTSLMASQKATESPVGIPFPHAEVTGKVVARRVIKRTILGPNIVIHGDNEQELVRALKDISNLNPKNRERLQQRRSAPLSTFVLRPVNELRNPHTKKLRGEIERSLSELSERSSTDDTSPVLVHPSPIIISPPSDVSPQPQETAAHDMNQSNDFNKDEKNANDSTEKRIRGKSAISSDGRSVSLCQLTPLMHSLGASTKSPSNFLNEDEKNANTNQSCERPERMIQVGSMKGDENNNPKMDIVHDHEFLIRKRDVTLNIVNENPYGPKKLAGGPNDDSEIEAKSGTMKEVDPQTAASNSSTKTVRGSMNRNASSSMDFRGTAGERRLLYQMESKSMRLKSEWRFTPETILESDDSPKPSDNSTNLCSSIDTHKQRPTDPMDHNEMERSARKDRSDSREAHVGSESDEVEDRMNEIDGEIRQMPVTSVLDKFTRFSPVASPDCSTSGSSSSNCSDLTPSVRTSPSIFGFSQSSTMSLSSHDPVPLLTHSRSSSLTSGSGTPSELEDAFFIDEDLEDQELLQNIFPLYSDVKALHSYNPSSTCINHDANNNGNDDDYSISDWPDMLDNKPPLKVEERLNFARTISNELSEPPTPNEIDRSPTTQVAKQVDNKLSSLQSIVPSEVISEASTSSCATPTTNLSGRSVLVNGAAPFSQSDWLLSRAKGSQTQSPYGDEEVRVSPHRCIATGNALYCGRTQRALVFEVRTLHAGEGFLSVTVQGPRREAVLETRLVLVEPGLFRVYFKVQLEGYYVIVVKWADWQVPGSPFLCIVTDK